MRGWVPRCSRLKYSGFDEHGTRFERTVQDFHARVVQHECDHLDGVLYPMRIRDLSKFGFNEALFPGQELPAEDGMPWGVSSFFRQNAGLQLAYLCLCRYKR